MVLSEAEYYCSQLGMEVPTIDNELDNLMIRGAIKKYAWIRNFYDGASTKKWKRDNYFSKHTTCPRGQSSSPTALFAGAEMPLLCASPLASIIDKYGIWGIAQPKFVGPIGAVCVRNAENEFTEKKPCASLHQFNEETGYCEWTGPKDSCFQLTDHVNRTWFMPLSNFPRETYRQFCLASAALTMNDNAVKLVVRRGCMFFGYAHPLYGTHPVQDTVTLSHRTYGDHIVPSHHNGAFPDWRIAISRVACWCDPTEATLNDHEPSPPKKNKCIEQHIFNETTQSCESIWEPKFCAELITNDGKRQQLEIPNWPTNRRYDELHFDNPKKREENFHRSVTDIVVRQHCWATLYSTANVAQRQTLASSGYGKHQVASSYNGLVNNLHDGTNRVVCECIR